MNTLDTAGGEHLTDSNDYLRRFYTDFWQCGPAGMWKLERAQTFREPDSPSWVAFAGGDWQQALDLTEARRPRLVEYYEEIDELKFYTARVRVVELPVSPYLQWESHLLRLRDELGGTTRAIKVDQVVEYERCGPLPEIVTIGETVMYRITYDDTGLLQGGVRYTDLGLVRQWRDLIIRLYVAGEDMQAWFEREVAPLPEPTLDR